MSLLKPSFSKEQLGFLQEKAEVFRENKEQILKNWQDLYFECVAEKDPSPSFRALLNGISILLDDFVCYLSRGDLEGYLQANLSLSHKISAIDVNLEEFTLGFHLFEMSYTSFLTENKMTLVEQFVTLDRLHHYTIGKLVLGYMEIKDATSFAIIRLAELKDPETAGHLERTREYSKLVAEFLELDQRFVNNIYAASPLHDLGKIGVPEGILLKPARLNKNEFAVMKDHADLGANALLDILKAFSISEGHLLMGYDIAKYHHEKWDGSGYCNLQGEEIPLAARIFALADIYDALISKRPYKPAYTHERAKEIILNGDDRISPSHFDPKVFEAFISLDSEFKRIGQQSVDNRM